MELRKIFQLKAVVYGGLLGVLGFLSIPHAQADEQQIAYQEGYYHQRNDGLGVGVGLGNLGAQVGVGTYDSYGTAPYSQGYYSQPYYNSYNTGPDVYIGGGYSRGYVGYDGYRDNYNRGGSWNDNRGGSWNDNRGWQGEGRSGGGGYSKGGYGGGGRR